MYKKAKEFAIRAHGQQMYGEHPYIFHLDTVAKLVSQYGEEAQTIAYLHDILEDTKIEILDIMESFDETIAESVKLITDEQGENRKERKLKTYKKLSSVSDDFKIVLIVKAADRLANVKSCIANKHDKLLAMYRKEYKIFRHSVYRNGLCDEIWEELDKLLES